MKRIAVIGCSGAGKSRFSQRLSARLGIRAHHLDRLYLDCSTPHALRGEFGAEHASLLNQPTWILDGNFGKLMDARFQSADTVIFLDLPPHSCLWGVIQRKFFSGKLDRDNKEGNLYRFTWGHIRYILLKHRRRHRPDILRKLGAISDTKRVIVPKSRAEVEALLRLMSGQGLAMPGQLTPKSPMHSLMPRRLSTNGRSA
jgi:adenylate kinase family enzyme